MTHQTYRRRRQASGETLMMIAGLSLAIGSLAILTAYLAFAISHDCKYASLGILKQGTAAKHLCSLIGY